ncbi:MAG: hypothetical protein JST00_36705 [Deltaproteobacteria bacterium]|nr:hypothetical protein [Deltaproteobacteria bacterium]
MMLRLRRGLWSLPVFVVAAACGGAEDTPRIAIGAQLVVPKGVLDKSSKLSLSVLEGSVSCEATTGAVTFPDGNTAASEIARSELEPRTDCSGGARFCGTLSIDKSSKTRVFSAIAKASDGSTTAVGCTATKIEQDAQPLSIKMFRFIAPADCSDNKLQPTEQCESAGGANCDDECLSKEILVSTGSGANGTQSGGVGDKSSPFFLWPLQTGTSGRFFAYYSDKNAPGTNPLEIGLRALSDTLEPLTSPPALAAGSIFLPNDPATFPPSAVTRQQSFPTAAFLSDRYWVAFQDDTGTASGIDIKMRSADLQLVAGQGQASPIGINGTSGAGEPAIQREPSMAASKGKLYIAWEDASGGSIAGRTFTPPGTLGSQNTLSSGSGNKGVSVAPTPNGWAVVWLSGTGVKLRIVNEDGTPGGAEQTVNESGSVAERPRIAALADGRFAVTWNAGGDIFVQRYDAKGSKIAGDQAAPINDVTDGDQTTPSIAGTTGVGGSYVVAWLDVGSNEVRGRMLGGSSGFLFNHVNGQATEFVASRVAGRTRANPVVAAGGSKPFVAIGWEDRTSPGAGIVVRRFPLPEE